MTSKRDSDLGALSGAYALDALAGPEKTEFEALMAESEQVRSEVTELTDTAVELGLSVAPEAPSPELRSRILDLVAQTPQLAPLVAEHEVVAVPVRPAEVRAQARWFQRPLGALAAAAAAVVLIVGIGFGTSQVIQAQNDMATASQVNEIQAATDYQRVKVPLDGGGTATLVWAVSLQRSALIVDGLKGLPAGSTYELWYIDKNGATPAGTFDVGSSGNRTVVLAGAMNAGDTVGVTVEPAGGSKEPSTDPVIVVQTA
jgi:anti-sigma-K factor RskA